MGVKDDPGDGRTARWSEPVAAYDAFRPGLSPYLHYFYDLRAERREVPPAKTHGPEDGAELPGQVGEALRDLIRRSFE